jgi:hypothetical protein
VFFLPFEFSEWECVLCFWRAKFVLLSTVLLGATRPMIYSEFLGLPISACPSKLRKYAYFGNLLPTPYLRMVSNLTDSSVFLQYKFTHVYYF